MKHVIYDAKPASIEAIGNGSFFYRWDIKEVQMEESQDSEENEPVTKWKCYETVVWDQLTADKITEAVIDAIWGNGVEQKLINDYNSANLGLLDESYKEPYLEFLTARKELKEEIAIAFSEFNQ